MPFRYDVIDTTRLSDSFRLDVWYCHEDTPERYVFNLQLVGDDGNELGMSAGDGQWCDTEAACEAAGRLYYLMKYAEAEA